MSTSDLLHDRVIAALRAQLGDPQPRVTATVSNGVVTLIGAVDSAAHKLAAERAVSRLSGVRAVAGGFHVVGDPGRTASDTAIAHAIVDALQVEPNADLSTVSVRVEHDWVTLTGRVRSMLAFDAVDRALECISVDSAVRGITSEVQLESDGAVGPRANGARAVIDSRVQIC